MPLVITVSAQTYPVQTRLLTTQKTVHVDIQPLLDGEHGLRERTPNMLVSVCGTAVLLNVGITLLVFIVYYVHSPVNCSININFL